MTSKERVLASLNLKKPDRVPFIDNIDAEMEQKITGKKEYSRLDVAEAFGLDAMGYDGFFPPIFAEQAISDGITYYTRGLINSRENLDIVKMPDLSDTNYFDEAKKFVDQNGGKNYALYARTRLGASAVLLSMGLENFAFDISDDTGITQALLEIYCGWTERLMEKIKDCGFDFVWCFDDIAYNNGPMMSPDVFRSLFIPNMKKAADACTLPWIYHSDGNLMPVLDDLLVLGMNGLHPLEPGPMDINAVKKKYGKCLCLIGNIDLAYTLTRGTVEEVDAEVKKRILEIGIDGGYMIASANTITKYCKPENVRSMVNAIKKYAPLA